MLDLFPLGQRPKIEVVDTDDEFWRKIERFCAPRSVFDEQGDAHADIDLRLVERIEAYLRPILGGWEESERWWHQMDFYGDGIRSLMFRRVDFEPRFVVGLHELLSGEHHMFCIVCQIHELFKGEADTKVGSIAIRSEGIMVTRPVAKLLTTHV